MKSAEYSLAAPAVPADLIPVGHVTGAYGLHGWIKIHPYSADAAALLHTKTWWLGRPAQPGSQVFSEIHDVEKLEAKRHGDAVVARMMGVVGRDAAENLKGCVVQIQRSHFPVLADDEFYWLDLIGLAVENLQGEKLGVVVDLIDNGAHPILKVVRSANHECLIPFVDRFVSKVDQSNKKITVDWGLDF